MWLNLILLFIFCFHGSLTTSFDLRGVLEGNRMGAIPLGMSLGYGELDVEGICTRPGMACQNCSQAVTCVPLPVGWLKVPLEACEEGFTCNARLGQCSKVSVPECSKSAIEFEHSCEQVGIFPDAIDCRKFHLCSPPEGLPDGRPADHRVALCPRHYAYNPASAQCSIKLDHSQCIEKPVPECKTVGQHGALALSSNHYYVCLTKNEVLYPQIFICPHGWHFWGEFCQPEPEKKEVVNNEKDSVEEKGSEENAKPVEETTTVEATTTHIESFFSTEESTTNAPDMFLADKLDLANYETIDDASPNNDDFAMSIEYGW